MSSLILPLADAKQLAKAIVPHASRDNVTPVLTHVVVGGAFGSFAFASDRYTIGRYDLTNVILGDVPEEDFFIPAKALQAVGMIGSASLPHDVSLSDYVVRFEVSGDDKAPLFSATVLFRTERDGEPVFVPHWMRTWEMWFDLRRPLTFPNVRRLFDDFIPGERELVHLGSEHLEKFTGYARQYGLGPIRITLSAPTEGTKTAPILIESGRRFKGLIQEFLVISGEVFGHDLAAENKAKDQEARRLAESGEAEGQANV